MRDSSILIMLWCPIVAWCGRGIISVMSGRDLVRDFPSERHARTRPITDSIQSFSGETRRSTKFTEIAICHTIIGANRLLPFMTNCTTNTNRSVILYNTFSFPTTRHSITRVNSRILKLWSKSYNCVLGNMLYSFMILKIFHKFVIKEGVLVRWIKWCRVWGHGCDTTHSQKATTKRCTRGCLVIWETIISPSWPNTWYRFYCIKVRQINCSEQMCPALNFHKLPQSYKVISYKEHPYLLFPLAQMIWFF